MFVRSQENSAVSNAIGTTLMVLFTVIAAAAFGQFVFDLVGLLEQPPQAGVTFSQELSANEENQYNVTIVLNAMPNSDKVIIRPTPPPGYDGGGLAGASFETVGEAQFRNYPPNTLLTVVAHNEQESVVVQTYKVGR